MKLDIRKKIRFLLICIVLMGVTTITGAQQKVSAAGGGNGVHYLNTWQNEQYDGADVTGDGKKDKVETVCSENELTLKVNDVTVKKWSAKTTNLDEQDICIVTLKNKKSYLAINEFLGTSKKGKTVCRLYQIKKGKLATAFDFGKIFDKKLISGNGFIYRLDKRRDFVEYIKVRENTLYVSLHITTKSLGYIRIFTLKVDYSKGKFRLKEGKHNVECTLETDDYSLVYDIVYTAAKKIQTVKSPGSSKKSITIKKNMKFSVKNASFTGGNIYVQVQTKDNKTGWIKLSKSSTPLYKKCADVPRRR